MQRKTWVLTLVAVGLVVAATSAAFNLNPSTWFSKSAPSAPEATTPTSDTEVPAPVPVPVRPARTMPN